jgi:uroporphyrinogen decarboxylase
MMSQSSGDPVFLRAIRREPTPYTPVWLMRQAGRYLPEYRRLRERLSFLELCTRPDVAAQVTVDAARRLNVDAAIVFADILLPLMAMGIPLHYGDDGPVIAPPLRTAEDVQRLSTGHVEEIAFVAETVRLVRGELETLPLIGFAGAPFTLASYLIEGGTSRQYLATKRFMYAQPRAWEMLMHVLVDVTTAYIHIQIDAGAQAIQLFDSWVGCLAPDDFRRFALPAMRRITESLPEGFPVIYFGTMTAGLIELMKETGAAAIGVDWRIALADAWQRAGYDTAIQGNLDPATLYAPAGEIRTAVSRLLKSVCGRPGHIFNLGHGVLPDTPVENVLALVEAVHEISAR